MKTKLGLWIDHKQAVIVEVAKKEEDLEIKVSKVISGVEKQLRRSGDSPFKGSFNKIQLATEDSHKRALMGHLRSYYDDVIASIRKADSILIFGPGRAKDELRERLAKNRLDGRIVNFESADKMSPRQIAAKVRDFYFKRAPGKVH